MLNVQQYGVLHRYSTAGMTSCRSCPINIVMDQIISQSLLQYHAFVQQLYQRTLEFYPRLDNYNHFEKFVLLNLAIIGLYLLLTTLAKISPTGIYRAVLSLIFSLGPVRNKLNGEIAKMKDEILVIYTPDLLPKLDKIPYKVPEGVIGDSSEKESLKGKMSGSRYALENHSKFVINLSKMFSYSNPLHLETFPLVKQMENEVIQMTADVIGLKDEKGQACGTLNSGGTESILMAILAYREYKMKVEGVVKPNLVICSTGHVAAIKGCHYMDIEVRVVPIDKEFKMDIGSMKSQIDDQTIAVYASYPNYPYGTCDPIETIAAICHKKGVPVHLDMCLGGFVSPFIEDNWKIPTGITSISADPHKYGLSAKGVSVLLYSSDKYRKHQYFVTSYWPGGLYGTPGLSGSRSGVFIASAWISMMKLGFKGYRENARILKETTISVGEELKKIGFEIFGTPNICVISFRHLRFSVNSIHSYMKKKGWGLSLLQNPLSFHFSFTPLNCLKKDEMIKDFRECIAELEKTGDTSKETSMIQLYGACAKIPDNGTKRELLSCMLDTFIDLN